ncbi:NAD-dependent epimerase/dehydratase family protein [Pleomorphomonas sp. PLEO]|uniref:NAD-dependent epimerase/dehydratase family protein n=1 Tax=Pleomorphomonas sp. PLEO TaxID=3239306 RepID=UPI00351E8AE9
MTQHIVLAGSTGLIGGHVRTRLAGHPDVGLISLTRTGSSAPGQPVDYEQLLASPKAVLKSVAPDGVDVAISCLGTTIAAAGSQSDMFRVDHDYVLALAEAARAMGARQFILVSSVGAGGIGFYLKTKGAIEKAVDGLGFTRFDIIRPGLLLGDRRDERPREVIVQRVFTALSPVMVGPLARYAAIPADTVAAAIVALTNKGGAGRYLHENADLRALTGIGQ